MDDNERLMSAEEKRDLITYLQMRTDGEQDDNIKKIITKLHNGYNNDALVGVELPSCYLQDFNFSGLNLTGADFQEATVVNANFSGANLTGANFTSAHLNGANFTGANLTNADFEDAIGEIPTTIPYQGGTKRRTNRKRHKNRKTNRKKTKRRRRTHRKKYINRK